MLQSRTAARAVTRSAPRPAHLWAVGLALALISTSAEALADKVAVLPFASASAGPGAATKAELDLARSATQSAVVKGGHTAPTPSEMLTAEMAVKDGVADTSEEFRAAGRASSSQWSISARVEPSGAPGRYRLELLVCQVKTGRVESLAREINGADSAQATSQIGEMLAILVRPEGIGNADITWSQAPPPLPPRPPPPLLRHLPRRRLPPSLPRKPRPRHPSPSLRPPHSRASAHTVKAVPSPPALLSACSARSCDRRTRRGARRRCSSPAPWATPSRPCRGWSFAPTFPARWPGRARSSPRRARATCA
ncbi:hypothetical protein [Pendulispora albinea]|uniref:Uncharacterized protein n=1 Tax=Pendulispora albinea TaxID=2741071 RepID=A0ABZ2M2T3_9BACT